MEVSEQHEPCDRGMNQDEGRWLCLDAPAWWRRNGFLTPYGMDAFC